MRICDCSGDGGRCDPCITCCAKKLRKEQLTLIDAECITQN